MARRRRKSINSKSFIGMIAVILILLAVIVGRNNTDFLSSSSPVDDDKDTVYSETVKVHFIDVGQGSSTLVQCGNTGMLIDAGEREYGDDVVAYLKKVGIEKLNYVVASHPHSDHIGGMIDVLNSFKVDNIILPKLTKINIPTTKLYEKFMQTILDRKINVIEAKYGENYSAGAVQLHILGPNEQVKDLNNMSVICRIKANKTWFLLPGDAEKQEMGTVNKKGANLKCDVIAMGHHGSRTSLDKNFLSAADPDVAVISCGKNNSYGHPHEETITYLKSNHIEYYRTDYAGNVVFDCDKDGYVIEK